MNTSLQAWEQKLMEIRAERRKAKREGRRYWTERQLAADRAAACVVLNASTNAQEV